MLAITVIIGVALESVSHQVTLLISVLLTIA